MDCTLRCRGWLIVALGGLLGACGGDEEPAAVTGGGAAIGGSQPNASASSNRAPTIGGTPPPAATVGMVYSFTPTASDADGDPLTFSIANQPAWASFDPATGRLSGTPGAGDVGAAGDVVISVDDGAANASLAAFDLLVHAVAFGSATLTWTPPTANTDGSPLTNLAGYKVYWGTSQGSFPNSVTLNNPGLTSYVVSNLAPGTYFFAATALNSLGAESTFSNAASRTVQ